MHDTNVSYFFIFTVYQELNSNVNCSGIKTETESFVVHSTNWTLKFVMLRQCYNKSTESQMQSKLFKTRFSTGGEMSSHL